MDAVARTTGIAMMVVGRSLRAERVAFSIENGIWPMPVPVTLLSEGSGGGHVVL